MSGFPYWNFVVDQAGNAIQGASVAVCTDGADLSTTPGSPLASIFSDEALTIPLANPMTTDLLGRYQFWAAAGTYKVQIYGSSPSFASILTTYVVPISLGGGVGGQILAGQIGFGSVTNTLSSGPNLLWDSVGQILSLINPTAATGGANHSSPLLKIAGTVWDGAASQPDYWTIQNVIGAGTLPGQTLTISCNQGNGAVNINASLIVGQVNSGAIFAGGDVTLTSAAATALTNINSYKFTLDGAWWNGAVSGVDSWTIQNVLGAGITPVATLTFRHTGAPGSAVDLGPGDLTVGNVHTPSLVASVNSFFSFNTGGSGGVFPLSAAANAVGNLTTYTAVITAASGPTLGMYVTIAGFLTAANNGHFVVHDYTLTSITVYNSAGVAEVHAGTTTTDFPYYNNGGGFSIGLGNISAAYPILGVSWAPNTVFETYLNPVVITAKGNDIDSEYFRIISDGPTGDHGLEIGSIIDGTGAAPVTLRIGHFNGISSVVLNSPLKVTGAINSTVGFQVAGAATTANVLRGNGTNFVSAALAATDLSDYAAGTWSPSFTNLTTVGAPTITGNFRKIGALVFISISIVPSTSTASVANSTFCNNLPYTPVADSTCQVTDDAVQNIGVGWVRNGTTKAYMPGWAADGNAVHISAVYSV